MIELPEAFVRITIAREGEPGAAWLAELPALVDDHGPSASRRDRGRDRRAG
jgi:hypothetical protein